MFDGPRREEEDLFFKALGQADPAARAAYLGRACAGKPVLRARVEEMLALQNEADRFFAEAQRAVHI